jgi:hypothetical protein
MEDRPQDFLASLFGNISVSERAPVFQLLERHGDEDCRGSVRKVAALLYAAVLGPLWEAVKTDSKR